MARFAPRAGLHDDAGTIAAPCDSPSIISNNAPLPLFVFGTLRDPLVLRLVLGRDPSQVSSCAAWLRDHVTVTLPEESYPVRERERGAFAPGLLLAGLSAADLDRIAFFEGEEYAFEETRVVVATGTDTAVPVSALLCAERSGREGKRHPWSLEHWQRRHRAAFLDMARRYMAQYGRLSVSEADRLWEGERWELE